MSLHGEVCPWPLGRQSQTNGSCARVALALSVRHSETWVQRPSLAIAVDSAAWKRAPSEDDRDIQILEIREIGTRGRSSKVAPRPDEFECSVHNQPSRVAALGGGILASSIFQEERSHYADVPPTPKCD